MKRTHAAATAAVSRKTQTAVTRYWLGRSDPLLNTIVPGVGVSLVINFGDVWAAGRSLVTSGLVPRV